MREYEASAGRPAFNIEAIKSKLRRILLPPELWSNDEVGAAAAAYVLKGRPAVVHYWHGLDFLSENCAFGRNWKQQYSLWHLQLFFDHHNK